MTARRPLTLLAALLLAACAPAHQIWFTPNIGSPDMLDLFRHPEQWPKSRGEISVFKFYAGQLVPEEVFCPHCGPNRLADLAQAGAFGRLREWKIGIAVEAPSVKKEDCRAEVNTAFTREAIQNVAAQGAAVRYVAMDEPLLGGDACGLSDAESAARTADFIRAVGRGNPSLLVGDIEPYPVLSAPRLVAWVAELARAGVPLAFFHLDVDRVYAVRLGVDVAADLRLLKSAFETAHVPFGVIFWGGDGTSDEAYAADVLPWARQTRVALDAMPEQVVFQSWVLSPDDAQRVPVNLPENDPAVYSHTRLINEGLAILRAK